MRSLTKIVLVLSLVALALVVLYVASFSRWGDKAGEKTSSSKPALADRAGSSPPLYSDPVATYERWRDRLTPRTPEEQPLPLPPAARAGPQPPSLHSSSRNEGTVAAQQLETPVAGADPPGPVLRPDTVAGEVITGPLRSKETEPGNMHTIVSGDTLYDIAVQRYGDARFVQAIMAANPGIDPNHLRVGDQIVLPAPEAKAEGTSASSTPAAPATKVYVVKKGDTLIGIARHIYGDAAMYLKIYEANKDVLSSLNARLYVGQRLRLPEPK